MQPVPLQALAAMKADRASQRTTHPAEVMKRGLWSSMLCTSSLGSKVRISTYRGRTAMMYGGWYSENIQKTGKRLIVNQNQKK